MDRIVNLGISVLLTGGVLALPAPAQDFPPMEMEIIQLNDDMYVIHNEFVPGNVTVLVTDEGVLLVDDKFEANYGEIVELLASVTDRAALAEFHGTVTAMRARTREMIAAESSSDAIEAMLRAEFYWGDLHLTMGFDGLLAEL